MLFVWTSSAPLERSPNLLLRCWQSWPRPPVLMVALTMLWTYVPPSSELQHPGSSHPLFTLRSRFLQHSALVLASSDSVACYFLNAADASTHLALW